MSRSTFLALVALTIPYPSYGQSIRAHALTAAQATAIDLAVGGTLTPARACYERTVGRHFGVFRTIVSLRLRIRADGSVTDLLIAARPPARAAQLRRCLLPLVSAWHIPSETHLDEIVSVPPERFERAVFQLEY